LEVKYWWTKLLPTQAATVTGVYTDAAMSSAYTSGGVAGSVLYIKMASTDVIHFREGHTALSVMMLLTLQLMLLLKLLQ